MRIAVFAYDFPHKKTQEFLVRLFAEGFQVSCVLAAPRVELKKPAEPPLLRTKPRRLGLVHPRDLCDRLRFPYHVVAHSTEGAADLLRESEADVGVVAGARILKAPVLGLLPSGIINFHPGLIPEARGLDALKWSIYRGLPAGNTAHFIDERIDAGWIIKRERLPVYPDDTLIDLGLRVDEAQIDMLPDVLRSIESKPDPSSYEFVEHAGPYEGAMPREKEKEVTERLEAWKEQMCAQT